MKARKGFLLSYDKHLRELIPFFVKVRSEDIVKTDPVDIRSVLVQTSMRWQEERVEDNVDATIYRYTTEWADKDDAHNETVDPEKFKGDLTYKLYKDGRMEVTGWMKMEFIDSDPTTGLLNYTVHLPYAFAESNPALHASWKFANLPFLVTAVNVDSVAITNAELNIESTGTYPYHLNVMAAWPYSETGTEAALFKNLATKLDPDYTPGMTVDEYLYSPTFNINYSGWWRLEKLPDIAIAKSYDEGLSGLYKTTGLVNLLSAPSMVDGKIVRPLPIGIVVRNHGYYTEIDGTKWLLCTYQSTNETGYIPSDILVAQ